MIYKLSTFSAPITPWDTSVTTTVGDPKARRSSLKKKKRKKESSVTIFCIQNFTYLQAGAECQSLRERETSFCPVFFTNARDNQNSEKDVFLDNGFLCLLLLHSLYVKLDRWMYLYVCWLQLWENLKLGVRFRIAHQAIF